MAFVPVTARLSPEEAARLPGFAAVVAHWSGETEGADEAAGWLREVEDSWGPAVLATRRGEEVLGFAVYGPPESLPHVRQYPLVAGDPAPVLAHVGGDSRTGRHLLVKVLKDLRQRGFGSAGAVAGDVGQPFHPSTRLLLESGWMAEGRCWRAGLPYTLARVELGNVVEVRGFAREIFGRVRLPRLKGAVPEPAGAGTVRAEPVRAVGSRS